VFVLRREDLVSRLGVALLEPVATVVTGEAGIGKTTLLCAAVARVGRPVLNGGALATLSWIEHLCLRRAVGRDLNGGDASSIAIDVAHAVGDGVLVLEDLQWAQPSTLEIVALLAGRIPLIASMRSGSAEGARTLKALRSAGFLELKVPPLDDASARELIRSVRPDCPTDVEDLVVRRAGGNPLLLTELAAHSEPPASLRLALGARLRALSADERAAFELVALAGRPVPRATVAPETAKRLLRSGLLITVGEDVAIRHSVLGETAVDLLGPLERRRRHARVARVTSDRGEAARHYELAGEFDLARAAAVEAAGGAANVAEAARHLQLAAKLSSGAEADELRLRAALALEAAHDLDGALTTLQTMEGDDPQAAARAALLRARIAWLAGKPEQVRPAVIEGLALVSTTNSELEVRLRIEESRVDIFVDADPRAGVASAAAALGLARSTGFAIDRAEYMLGTALIIADLPDAPEHLTMAIELARRSGDTETELAAASNLISFHESAGSPSTARRIVEEMHARAGELGLTIWQAGFLMANAALDFHRGELQLSLSGVEQVLALPLDARSRDYAAEVKVMDLVDLGRADEAERFLSTWTAIDDYKGTGQLLWARAEAAQWGGHPRRALPLIERYLDGPEADPNLVLGQITRTWARYEAGLDPDGVIDDHVRPMLKAARPESRAVAALAEDPAAAAAMFAHAAGLWAPYHCRGELRCRWAQGEALRRAAAPDDAVEVLRSVEMQAERMGHLMILGRIRRSLRLLGERRTAPRTVHPDGLTGREREVLALVGQGLTNAQIATRLGVGRRTIVAIIDSASRKLGAASRAQAASLAEGD
jgi:DNA-binding CsgD family transcriptional regulator/tetratricopeptide (TPR) repeat protein